MGKSKLAPLVTSTSLVNKWQRNKGKSQQLNADIVNK
jgi:hypothetical protein